MYTVIFSLIPLPLALYRCLKPELEEGVAYRQLLVILYLHLLEECLTAGAADMNRPNYCPVNSSTQVAGQFPSQAYLFVYIIGLVSKSLETSIQVVGHQDMKQGVHWPADIINHAYISVPPEEFTLV